MVTSGVLKEPWKAEGRFGSSAGTGRTAHLRLVHVVDKETHPWPSPTGHRQIYPRCLSWPRRVKCEELVSGASRCTPHGATPDRMVPVDIQQRRLSHVDAHTMSA